MPWLSTFEPSSWSSIKGKSDHCINYMYILCKQRRWTSGTLPSFPPLKMTNLLLHWLGWVLWDFKVALSSSQSRPLYSFILAAGILNVIFIFSPETALGTAVMLLIFRHLCICALQSRSCVYISNLPADEETRCPVCLNQANEAADSSFSKEGRRAEYQMSCAPGQNVFQPNPLKSRSNQSPIQLPKPPAYAMCAMRPPYNVMDVVNAVSSLADSSKIQSENIVSN